MSEVDAVGLGPGHSLGLLLDVADRSRRHPLRQLGILVFVANVGLSSGPALAASITRPVGLKLLGPGVVLSVLGAGLLALLSHRLAVSPTRSGGLIAGFMAVPACSPSPPARPRTGGSTG